MREINISTRRKRVANHQLYDDYYNFPSITKKIYNLVLESGLTQKEFADKVGLTQQTLCRLFKRDAKTSKYPKVTNNIKEKIMAAYNLPLEWFIVDGDFNAADAPQGEGRKATLARLQYVKDYLIDTGRITSIHSLCDIIDVSRSYVNLIFNGKLEITIDFLNALNEAFDYIFDINWILTGQGDILKKKNDTNDIVKELLEENSRLKAKLNEAAMEIINLNSEIRTLKAKK